MKNLETALDYFLNTTEKRKLLTCIGFTRLSCKVLSFVLNLQVSNSLVIFTFLNKFKPKHSINRNP